MIPPADLELPACLHCTRWIASLGAGQRDVWYEIAVDLGVDVSEVRARALLDYHAQHLRQEHHV